MTIKFQINQINSDYLLELCRKKILYLILGMVLGGAIAAVYEFYSKKYTAKVTYFYNSSPSTFESLDSVDHPGISLARWQMLIKGLPAYVVSIDTPDKNYFQEVSFLSSAGWYENSIRPILSYTKMDIREYSQLTAQGVLEKNNVLGFIITTSAPSRDAALNLNSKIHYKFLTLSESFFIKEVLHSKVPWLWNKIYYDLMITQTQDKIKMLRADIEFLRKLSIQSPEIMKSNSAIINLDPNNNFAYLPLAIQLNSRIYQLELSERYYRELTNFDNHLTKIEQVFFGEDINNKNGILSYKNLLLANKISKNLIMRDVYKKIDSEIRFFKGIVPLQSSITITSSFKISTIIYSIIFSLIFTSAFLVLVDKKYFLK
jgi:hypothetical protein